MKSQLFKPLSFLTMSVLMATVGFAQSNDVRTAVRILNIAPTNGVAITPVWAGFHSGSFDSYNGGLLSLPGLERIAEDGNTSLVTAQFNDFNPNTGGYTYVDTSGSPATSALVRTGDLSDQYRQDATISGAPLLPGQAAAAEFVLRADGSNDFFSYLSMVLPTNDFFIANGNAFAHNVSQILANGGSISFAIGTPNGGVNDAGTEVESFLDSAGNPLFAGRNLPAGQSGPNEGMTAVENIANVVGNPYADFDLAPEGANIDVTGLDFNQYTSGIAMVTITAGFEPGDVNGDGEVNLLDVQPFVEQLTLGMYTAESDIDQDGQVTVQDVAPFVQLLTQ